MSSRLFSFSTAFSVAASIFAAQGALAQDYPTKPIRLIVPYPPGAGTDIIARTVGQKLGEVLGQQVVVDNRGGGGTIIATQLTARAVPDGHTLLLANAALGTNPALIKDLPYDTLRDFAPVSLIGYGPLVLVAHPSVPARTVKELVALCKAKPGQINYASGGNGTSQHLAAELLRATTKISVVHVPYKGAAPAMVDLIGGQLAFMFSNTIEVVPYVKAGRLRALGISSAKRSAAAPSIPTIAETGMPGFESTTWFGMLAPARTPAALVERLHEAVAGALRKDAIRERLSSQGYETVGNLPREFGAIIQAIPLPVMGGVSIVVFGLIAVAGAKIWVDNRVDFSQNKNLIVAAINDAHRKVDDAMREQMGGMLPPGLGF